MAPGTGNLQTGPKAVEGNATTMTQTSQDKSLYERLGGYDAIAAATDDLLLGRLVNDPLLGVYWKGKSEDSLRRDRQLIVDFLVQAAGGPGFYFGRDMRTSHTRLGTLERSREGGTGSARLLREPQGRRCSGSHSVRLNRGGLCRGSAHSHCRRGAGGHEADPTLPRAMTYPFPELPGRGRRQTPSPSGRGRG